MLTKFSSLIAQYINNNISNKSRFNINVLSYGIECILITFIPIIFYFIYSIVNNCLLAFIVWIIVFLIHRNNIGGFHASSHLKCLVLSTIYGIFSLSLISNFQLYGIISIIFVFLFFTIIHIVLKPFIRNDSHDLTIIQSKKKAVRSIIIIFILTVLSFLYFNQMITNSIFIGYISSELLFLIYKFQLYINILKSGLRQ